MKIEIGKKYRTIGWLDNLADKIDVFDVEIIKTGMNLYGGYSVVGLIKRGPCDEIGVWSEDGRWFKNIDSFKLNLVEVPPYDDFKIDDPVVVWSSDGCKYKRHFAGINDFGRPLTYDTGQTSWTSKHKITTAWDRCIKAEDYKEPL